MKRPPKDCFNCKYNILTCGNVNKIDKRILRKLIRVSDSNHIWDRYYCNRHKYSKRNIHTGELNYINIR